MARRQAAKRGSNQSVRASTYVKCSRDAQQQAQSTEGDEQDGSGQSDAKAAQQLPSWAKPGIKRLKPRDIHFPRLYSDITSVVHTETEKVKRLLMEHVEVEAPRFIFKDGPVKDDEKALQHCAYWFGLSVVKEKLVDGRFRTIQYDMQAIPEDGNVQLKGLCFGQVQVPDVMVNISAPIIDYGTTLAYPHPFTIAPMEEREKWELDEETCLRMEELEQQRQPFIDRLKKLEDIDYVEDKISEEILQAYKERESEGRRLRRQRREKREARQRRQEAAANGEAEPDGDVSIKPEPAATSDVQAGDDEAVEAGDLSLGGTPPEAKAKPAAGKEEQSILSYIKQRQEELAKKAGHPPPEVGPASADYKRFYRTSFVSRPRLYAISTPWTTPDGELRGITQGMGTFHLDNRDPKRIFLTIKEVRVMPNYASMDMAKWRQLFAKHEEQMDADGQVVVPLATPMDGLYRDVVYMDDEMQMCRLTDGGCTVLKRMFAF